MRKTSLTDDAGTAVTAGRPVRVAVWGIGAVYAKRIGQLLKLQELDDVRLVAAADAAPPLTASLDGMPVIRPNELDEGDFDFLLLTNTRQQREMIMEATAEHGIPRQKIVTHDILAIPNFRFREYLLLRESDTSIVSDTMWGMNVCKTLQMPCHSPFAGTSFKKYDYLKLLSDLDSYLSMKDLPLLGERYDGAGNKYLAFSLGDIELRAFGKADPETARADWLAGCEELNRDNLFVQMSTTDPLQERSFNALDQFEKRICFVPYESRLAHSLRIPVIRSCGLFERSVQMTSGQEGRPTTLDLVKLLMGTCDLKSCGEN